MKLNNKFWIISFVFIGMILILFNSCKKDEIDTAIKDIDGNIYHSITIGTQVWMLENLKTTRYRNGDSIPNIIGYTWVGLNTGAYCNYNDDLNYGIKYGHLYNWKAVSDSRNIAPKGWHVPSNEEWKTLIDFLGGKDVAGGKMKERDTLNWLSPNTGATNESGFSGLPGMLRLGSWHPEDIGRLGSWWSTTVDVNDPGYAYAVFNVYNNTIADRSYATIIAGMSVRCIKD